MTSIIKLYAVSGALDESPPCYILQVDELRILLDCGWDENFDQDFIKELKRYIIYKKNLIIIFCMYFHIIIFIINSLLHFRHVNQIDAILLSYPDPLHLGALPYLVGKCGLNCPIYATIPVYKMGQMFMYDMYQVLFFDIRTDQYIQSVILWCMIITYDINNLRCILS